MAAISLPQLFGFDDEISSSDNKNTIYFSDLNIFAANIDLYWQTASNVKSHQIDPYFVFNAPRNTHAIHFIFTRFSINEITIYLHLAAIHIVDDVIILIKNKFTFFDLLILFNRH